MKIIKKILNKLPSVQKIISEKESLSKENQNIKKQNSLLKKEIINLSQREKEIKIELFKINQQRYEFIIEKLKQKVKNKQKIKVCFLVMYRSSFAAEPLYQEMLKNDIFDPFIVIIPDISRGEEYMKETFNRTYSTFPKNKNIIKGYNLKTKNIVDISNQTDIVSFPTPYTGMSFFNFELNHFLKRDILPFYINYSFSLTKFSREIFKIDFYEYLWKIFVPTYFHLKEFKNLQLIKGSNVETTGYCKMDNLDKQKSIKRKRKTIIIAPHHTISNWKSLQISNFLKYYNFFLELPRLYPNIDFIFRPHQLLVTQLKKPEIWGEKKTNKYFKEMESNPNVIYSKGGEYFDIFANSDGIIHDCGSFLAEYLFTEKPACYMLKNQKSIKKWFLPIGQECLKHCYQAFSKKDILFFIDQVVLKDKDPIKDERIKFVNSKLKINYPNVSRVIINYIKKQINI